MQRLLLLLLIFPFFAAFSQPYSKWVYPGNDGKLHYKATAKGDRIMDFSHAGYKGGGVAFPSAPVKITLQPSGGDDTKNIQAAIDTISLLPEVDGIRGALLLAPGVFTCDHPITITTGGVILRGSGSGQKGTTIKMTGAKHTAIVIGQGPNETMGGEDDHPDQREKAPTITTTITDTYVPAGTNTFTVANIKGFDVRNSVEIKRTVTAKWVAFMQMHNLVRDGKPQTWIGANRSSISKRKIIAINGNRITVDIPFADSYDAAYLNPPGTTISTSTEINRTVNVGVEKLHIQCPPLEIDYAHAPYSGIRILADDSWVKDVYFEETMNTSVLTGDRITMQQVVVKHTYPNLGASKPGDFGIDGSQILLDRCESTGDNQYFVWTTSLKPGPNVVLNSTFKGHGSRIQPHQRWSTGLLVDNCTVIDGGIDFMNRGVAGSGHGWTMGWAVAWNCIAQTYIIQNPPGTINWSIGCIGKRVQTARLFDSNPILQDGVYDSYNTPVAPQSLYLAQLLERKGIQALKNTGYISNTLAMFPNKHVPHSASLLKQADKLLGNDEALYRPVNTSSVKSSTREFGGEKALDGNPQTYWAPAEGDAKRTIEIDMEGPVDINAIELAEPKGKEGRVLRYKVEGQVQSDWLLLSGGTSIGSKKVDRFPTATVWKVRVSILQAKEGVGVSKIGLYKKMSR